MLVVGTWMFVEINRLFDQRAGMRKAVFADEMTGFVVNEVSASVIEQPIVGGAGVVQERRRIATSN